VVTAFAQQILIDAANPYQPDQVGEHWVERFISRHPSLHTKIGRAISHQRVEAANLKSIKAFYSYLECVRPKYRIDPQNEYNVDETGVQKGESGHETVIGTSATQRARIEKSDATSWVSIIEYISPIGGRGTPSCIFAGRSV
jgi:hypothetical protein